MPYQPCMKIKGDMNIATVEVEPNAELNPFMVDVILENLFRYLDFQELSTCRLACRKWYKLSFTQWLNLNQNRLLLSGSLNIDYSKIEISGFLQLFHNDFHTYDEYEYAGMRKQRKFSLCNLNLQKQIPVLNFFYQKCGEWITNLHINFEFPNLETFENIILSRFTPNVKTFFVCLQMCQKDKWNPKDISNSLGIHDKLESLRVSSCIDHKIVALSEEAWLAIFRRYSKLLSLECWLSIDISKTRFNEMIESARKVRREGSGLNKLKSFKVSNMFGDISEVTSSQLKFSRETGVKLETLGICVAIQSPSDVWDLLCLHAKTIRRLILYNRVRHFEHFKTPRMPNLQTLEIYGFPISRIEFLSGFENLQALIMNDEFGDYTQSLDFFGDIDIHKNVFHSLTKFNFYQNFIEGEKPVDETVIRRLQKSMPNIKNLEMFLSNETFREVCKCWPKLEHLEIVGNLVDDEGITGVLANGETMEPSIACLKELMSFIYLYDDENINNEGQPPKFTQSSIRFGLLMLPNLQSIECSFHVEIDGILLEQLKQKGITFQLGNE